MSVHDLSSIGTAKELARKLGIAGDTGYPVTPEEADDGRFLAEDYGMTGQPPAEPERDLEIIEGEILFYKRQAGGAIIEIGKRLTEAKAQLRHGEWLPWLREKVSISERSAQDFMRVAREYSKSAEIADLGASKALALLALPASEREGFAAEKHVVDGVEKSVSEMTAKELKRAIEERDEARKTVEAMKARAEVAENARDKMEKDMQSLKELSRRAKETAEKKTADLAAVEKELEELRNRPVDVAVQTVDASPEQIEKAKADGAEEAAKKHKEQLAAVEEKLNKAKKEAEQARLEAENATAALRKVEHTADEYRKQAEAAGRMAQVNSNQNMVKFGLLFQQAQDTVNQITDSLRRETPENQEKMRRALQALADAIREAAS